MTASPVAALAEESLGEAEFAQLLGVRPDELPAECRAAIAAADFRHAPIEGAELAALRAELEDALDAPLAASGPERRPAWEAGWGDIRSRFVASGGSLAELEPHYFRRPSEVMRLFGRWVRPADPRFEARFVAVMQAWVARRWLGSASAVFEFGCGPGHNLVALARLLPGVPLVGLDWAQPSQEILARVAAETGLPIEGRRFDMFAPDPTLTLPPGAAVLTVGAMEQLGTRFDAFLDFLLERRPRIAVHLEPIHELYDRPLPFDDLAARYAERRGYLRGFLPALERLDAEGRVELLEARRHLGSKFHDGWGSLVWRPRPHTTEGRDA